MCLIGFSFDEHPRWTLVLAANRDEFYDRPALPAAWWHDAPAVYAGRDLSAGGTWLGVDRRGRLAAVTNVREPGGPAAGARSRGELVAGFLRGDAGAASEASEVAALGEAYGGFNLLLFELGARPAAGYVSNRDPQGPRALAPGRHGLSNHLLDTRWPKVETLDRALAEALELPQAQAEERLFAALADRRVPPDESLPETGVGLERERLLGPAFIASGQYGTRVSTVVFVGRDGRVDFVERGWRPGAPEPVAAHERRARFAIAG